MRNVSSYVAKTQQSMVAAALRQADLHVAVLQLPFIILLQQHRTD